MSYLNGPKSPADSLPELPPVEAPTAGFIVQLFVIPAIVVAVVIGVWLLFGQLAAGERDPAAYLKTIREDNYHRRWRAAYELASLIQNDTKLARDPALLGDLAVVLEQELAKPGGDPKVPEYLALAMGAFQTTEATPAAGRSADALATLAHALDPAQPGAVRVMAAVSLGRLGSRVPGGIDHAAASQALAQAVEDADPELRQRAAYSLGYFRGETASEALRKRVKEDEDRTVRYNAAAALARRGDPAARDVLREMLSPRDLAQVVRGETPSEASRRIEAIELEALWALQESVREKHPDLARSVRAEIQKLRASAPATVRIEAETLLQNLQSAE